jgi:hypothetical protein
MLFLRKKIIGLEIDENFVTAAELAGGVKGAFVTKYAPAGDLNQLLRNNFFNGAEVVISIPAQLVLNRTFYPPASFLNKPKELVSYLSHQNLPFKLEDCYWDVFNLDKYLNFVAAKKDTIDRYLAQFESLGLKVKAIINPQIALYNVFIYNNPGIERFALLNIRNSASDLLIYESKRLMPYPLPMGKKDILEGVNSQESFCVELERLFNAHYLQSPRTEASPLSLFLSGQSVSASLIAALNKALPNYQVKILETMRKISPAKGSSIADPEVMALSLGLCLTYIKAPGCLQINLIKRRISGREHLVWMKILKGLFSLLAILASALILFWDINLAKTLKQERLLSKELGLQVSALLPELKGLTDQKQKLEQLKGVLSTKMDQQMYFLESLAAVSETKPPTMKIKEFEAKLKDNKIGVSLTVTGVTYEEVNGFLSKLKRNKHIKEVKADASSFPGAETESKAMDFRLSFELTFLEAN